MNVEQTYLYGVQWVDDGGPFYIPTITDDLIEPFNKMGLQITDVIEDGAVILNNGQSHYVIKTQVAIPSTHWRQSERWSSNLSLWLHTFTIEESEIKQQISLDEWDTVVVEEQSNENQ